MPNTYIYFMKKLKAICLWFLRFGLSGVLIAFLCVAPFSLLPDILKAQGEVNKKEEYDYQGVLELWHIETFEGGSLSRTKFLESEAMLFEKKHKGAYVALQTISLEQLELNLKAGKVPNMISFGIGVGELFLDKLAVLDGAGAREDLLCGAKFNGQQLAVPYILGGYAMIYAGDGLTGVGLVGATNPLQALQKNNIKVKKFYNDLNVDSYTAYDRFLRGNYKNLIGTQRDVYRCFNRSQKGLLTSDLTYKFLGGYTDLVQYLSVFRGSDIEQKICKEFAMQVISSNAQSKLNNYNLFSVRKDVTLYSDGLYKDFEMELKRPLICENVFLPQAQILQKKQHAYKAVC